MRRKQRRHKEVRLSRIDARVPIGTAERWAYRDEHTRQVLHAVATCDADLECSHGHLPADPSPTCSCWGELTVREAEALRHDFQLFMAEVRRHNEEVVQLLTTLVEMQAHTDRNVTAVGFQVSKAGDNGR